MSGFKIDGCSALITGASAGIGREFARQLASHARSLVLVARRAERLEQLRDELVKRDPNLHVRVRVVDLAERSQIDSLCDWLAQEKIDPNFLINNAGLGDMGLFATADPDRVDQILRVNVIALTALTRKLLPTMIARKRGAILNVSSSAGFLPIAGFAVYAATKAYVTSFSETIRAELYGTGVKVSTLCPGPVHTEFGDVANRPGRQPERGPEVVYVSVERVVRDAIAGIEGNRALVIPGFMMKLGMLFVRLTPMSILRLASRISETISRSGKTFPSVIQDNGREKGHR
jgi:short-subunit dehydrogenase